MQDGFIAAAAVAHAEDGSWIQVSSRSHIKAVRTIQCCFLSGSCPHPQVTGCLDVAHSHLDPSDSGGQFDVRFPNGAKCTFGGYGASFIEQFVCSSFRAFTSKLILPPCYLTKPTFSS